MSAVSKKVAVGIIGLLVLLAAGGYVGISMLESDQEKKVAEMIGKIPGEFKADSIGVSFFSKKVTIKGLKGTYSPMPQSPQKIEVGTLVVQGINLEAGSKPGVMHLADTVDFSDLVMEGESMFPGPQPVKMKSRASVKSGIFKGIKGDLAAFSQLGPLPTPPQNPNDEEGMAYLNAISGHITVYSTFHIDLLESVDYTFSIDEPFAISGRTAKVSYKDFSLLDYGPISVEKLSIDYKNNNVASVERVGIEKITFPDMFSGKSNVTTLDAYAEEVLEAFRKKPMVMKGLSVEKLVAKPFNAPAPVTLDKMVLSIEYGPEKLVWQKKVDSLVLPAFLLAALDPSFARALEFHQESFEFDSALDMVLTAKDGSGNTQIKTLAVAEKNLGNVAFNLEMPLMGEGKNIPGLFKNNTNFFLKSFGMVLEDKGLVELALKTQARGVAQGGQPVDTAVFRQGLASLATNSGNRFSSPDIKRIFEGLAKLAMAPGKLTVSVNPPQPVNIDDLTRPSLQMELNAKVDYEAAK